MLFNVYYLYSYLSLKIYTNFLTVQPLSRKGKKNQSLLFIRRAYKHNYSPAISIYFPFLDLTIDLPVPCTLKAMYQGAKYPGVASGDLCSNLQSSANLLCDLGQVTGPFLCLFLRRLNKRINLSLF